MVALYPAFLCEDHLQISSLAGSIELPKGRKVGPASIGIGRTSGDITEGGREWLIIKTVMKLFGWSR